MWWVRNEVDITLIFTKKIMFCKQHLYLHLTHHHVLVQRAFIKNLLADAPSHVAATTLMAHCVSQIATAFPNSGNI